MGQATTVSAAIDQIAKKVKKENLHVKFVATSYQSTWQLQSCGLDVLDSCGNWNIDWGFDGADAVDESGAAVKGRGGAMLREKILAAKCKKYYLIVDDSKLVDDLAKSSTIPVEVIPEAIDLTMTRLIKLGVINAELRIAEKKHGPVITEAGNVIIDVKFDNFVATLEDDIKQILGVVESGLFIGYADQVFVSKNDQVIGLLDEGSDSENE